MIRKLSARERRMNRALAACGTKRFSSADRLTTSRVLSGDCQTGRRRRRGERGGLQESAAVYETERKNPRQV